MVLLRLRVMASTSVNRADDGYHVEALLAEVILSYSHRENDDGVEGTEYESRLQLGRVVRFGELRVALLVVEEVEAQAEQSHEHDHGQEGWSDHSQLVGHDHPYLDQHPNEGDRGRNEDDQGGQPARALRPGRAFGVGDGGRRAGDESAEDAPRNRTHVSARPLINKVCRNAEPDDQHHHGPDLAGIQHAVGAVVLVRQQGKYDEIRWPQIA